MWRNMIWYCLVLILLLLAALCVYCFMYCFYAANKKEEDIYRPSMGTQYLAVQDEIIAITKRMEEVPFEPVTVTSFDGLTLFGRYYHQKDGAPVKILFHGYRSTAVRDGAGGFELARKLGLNVLAVDQRAHGRSQGHVISFGINERRDFLSWIEYINNRFGTETPVILSGISMGAATVLMAASLPLPKNVTSILADCPYSSPAKIIRKVSRDVHIPDKIVYPFISLSARVFGGFKLEETGAGDAVKESPVPILLIHGEDDRFVPCEMSRQIHTSSHGRTRLETFPGAGHGLSYMVDPKRYESVVYDFLLNIPALSPWMQDVTV